MEMSGRCFLNESFLSMFLDCRFRFAMVFRVFGEHDCSLGLIVADMNWNGEYSKFGLSICFTTLEFRFCECRFSKPVIFQTLSFQ